MRTIRHHFLCILLLLPLAGHAENWPFFRGPNGNGIADLKFNPVDDPEIVWKENVGHGGEWGGAPVVANGRLFIHGGRGTTPGQVHLLCLDGKTGKEIWKAGPYPRTDTAPSIHLESGRIFTLDGARVVRCLDLNDGAEIWTAVQLPDSTERRSWGHAGSPVLWEDLVFVNVGYGAALQQSTGEVAWHFDGYSGMATPVLFEYKGKPAVAFFGGDQCIGRDARTGAKLWAIPWKTQYNAADPLIFDSGNKVFLSCGYRGLYDVSEGDAKEIWFHDGKQDVGSHGWFGGFYHNAGLYMMTSEGIACVNQADGSLIWRKGPRGFLMKLSGQIVLSDWNGLMQVFNLSADNLEETLRAQVAGRETWNSPAYADGLWYARTKSGDLFCARVSE